MRMWRQRAVLGVAVLAWMGAAPALAQGKKPKPDPELVAIYKAGEKAYTEGDYQTALDRFREAYERSKKPSLLYNMGQCQRLLGQLVEARDSYRQFMAEVPDSPVSAEVSGYLVELDAKIAEIEAAKKPKEPLPPPAKPFPLARRLLLSGGLALGSLAMGGGSFLLRADGEIASPGERTAGLALSVAADAALVASLSLAAVSLVQWRASSSKEKPAVAALGWVPGGASLRVSW